MNKKASLNRQRLLYGEWTEPEPYTDRELQEIASKLLNIRIGKGNEPLYSEVIESGNVGDRYFVLRRTRDPQELDTFIFNREKTEPTAKPATIRFESGGKIYEENM